MLIQTFFYAVLSKNSGQGIPILTMLSEVVGSTIERSWFESGQEKVFGSILAEAHRPGREAKCSLHVPRLRMIAAVHPLPRMTL
jgi:hypothetical protein